MAAITNLSDLINRLTGGNSGSPETVFFHKVARSGGAAVTAPVQGRMASMWTYDGMPAAGSAPGAAAIPTRTTVGAIPFTAPGGSREKFLISAGIVPTVAGVYILYDRLLHESGLSGTSTADQTVQGTTPTPALTRNTGGAGNFVFYEIYSVIGTTSVTLTMTYTNQDGTTGKTSTINIGASGFREVTRAQRIPLAAGDTGVRAVDKIALSATTGAAGDFGITIGSPIAYLSVGTGGLGGWRDYTTGLPGIPAIDTNACLSMLYIPVSAIATEIQSAMTFVEK